MTTHLRALLVEDSEEDAFLLLRYLRKSDYDVDSERVDTPEALREVLARGPWDIAFCDYVMPLLRGEDALRILKVEAPDLPVITVSGNVGEEFAVDVMRAGAKDYVRKDNLSRLIPAIERELADAAARRERRGLEDRLREAEIRADTLFASMQQGVIYRDAEGRIIAANPAATRILGLGLEKLLGKIDPGWRLVREDGSPLSADAHPALVSLRSRRPTHELVIGVYAGDELRWILVDAVPEFRPGEDAPYRVFSTFTDITERKNAEAALRASEARFEEMAEGLPEAVWITAPDGTTRYTNRRWTEYSGLSEDESRGNGWLQQVHPDDRDSQQAAWQAAVSGMAPFEFTSRFRRADGAYRWFKTSAVPVRDARGTIVRWAGISADIDEQKRLEDEVRRMNAELEARIEDTVGQLRASEERMTLAFEASQDGIWDWNVETGHVWYSDHWGEMLGYAPDEIRPTYDMWREAVHPDDLKSVEESVAELMRGERPYDTVYRLRHRDGHYLTVQSRGVVQRRNATGEVVRVIGTHHDITNLKRAESALRAAIDDLQSFNDSVSHDLRAPLRHIHGFAEILADEYGAQMPANARDYVAKVHAGTERMGRMIEALLHLSRVGRAELERRRTDMTELAKTAWADVCSTADAGRVAFTVRELPEADADPMLLRQVLGNLLDNALKSTRTVAQPRIEVGIESDGGEPVFHVRDNGVGFDPEFADRLFSVFQKLHAETDFEGNGVGLSIVKRIIEKHGGRVWAESSPGEGATFFFTLPPRADAGARGDGSPRVDP
ncbi:MAG: PAS domain-containing protein [Candidatus Binatia bacterium]